MKKNFKGYPKHHHDCYDEPQGMLTDDEFLEKMNDEDLEDFYGLKNFIILMGIILLIAFLIIRLV